MPASASISDMTMLLSRHGRALAVVGARRYYLAPNLDERIEDDPERRAVVTLCRVLIGAAPCLPAFNPARVPQSN